MRRTTQIVQMHQIFFNFGAHLSWKTLPLHTAMQGKTYEIFKNCCTLYKRARLLKREFCKCALMQTKWVYLFWEQMMDKKPSLYLRACTCFQILKLQMLSFCVNSLVMKNENPFFWDTMDVSNLFSVITVCRVFVVSFHSSFSHV